MLWASSPSKLRFSFDILDYRFVYESLDFDSISGQDFALEDGATFCSAYPFSGVAENLVLQEKLSHYLDPEDPELCCWRHPELENGADDITVGAVHRQQKDKVVVLEVTTMSRSVPKK
ncbi:hypothetical protein RchiOBHm_Chr2g0113461 [Rosa chinensis]|uniref:Uncharacterized protein n=1 Tax=Rosa chinensis TaxID=74649 RepID=A0A2P6RQM1_ROSCH|nr:hypothetical protein RchiOBHm_Chr2g0113461 [Rosa chinensis]